MNNLHVAPPCSVQGPKTKKNGKTPVAAADSGPKATVVKAPAGAKGGSDLKALIKESQKAQNHKKG